MIIVNGSLATAAFCGGAELERQAEIRAPAICGQFRWWFRTLGGFASLSGRMNLREQEAMIFGSISGGEGQAGKLILRIKNGPKPSTTTRDDEKSHAPVGTDRGYLAFPLKSKRDRDTHEILEYKGRATYDSRDDAGDPMQLPTFDLDILWRGPVLQWDDLKALVCVFANFGSPGFRSRRALGALCLNNSSLNLTASLARFATPSAVAAFSLPVTSTKEPANDSINKLARWLRACLKTPAPRRVRARGLQDLAEKPVACRPGALTGRVLKHALRDWRQHGRSITHQKAPNDPQNPGFDYALRDHDEGLAGLGRSRPASHPSGHTSEGAVGESFRPAIGLPIIQFFSSLDVPRRQATLDWIATADGGRFASPILLRPHFDGTVWRALVIFLDTRQWDSTKPVHLTSGPRAITRQVLPDLYNAMKRNAAATMTPFP